MPLIHCPDCGREVSDAAPACPQCGRPAMVASKKATQPVQKPPMPEPTRPTFITPGTVVSHSLYRPVQRPSNAGPAIASLLLPGLGQVVQGRMGAAAFWFLASAAVWVLTLIVGLPGLGAVANVWSAIDAARWDGR